MTDKLASLTIDASTDPKKFQESLKGETSKAAGETKQRTLIPRSLSKNSKEFVPASERAQVIAIPASTVLAADKLKGITNNENHHIFAENDKVIESTSKKNHQLKEMNNHNKYHHKQKVKQKKRS